MAPCRSRTYIRKDRVGGLHAGVDVVGHVTVYQPRARVVRKQFNGLERAGKEIIHVFSVGLIYLQRTK